MLERGFRKHFDAPKTFSHRFFFLSGTLPHRERTVGDSLDRSLSLENGTRAIRLLEFHPIGVGHLVVRSKPSAPTRKL